MKRSIFVLASALLTLETASAKIISDPTAIPPIVDADAINRNVNPCADFYQFACGQWLNDLQMPGDKATYFHQFTALEDQTQTKLRTLIENAPQDSQIGKLYASCMNESAAEISGRAALGQIFSQIDSISDSKSIAQTLAQLHLQGVSALFGFGPAQDLNNAAQVIGFATEGGMSLPERDYYLKDDAKSVETRQKYVSHLSRMFELTGIARNDKALKASQAVLDFEKTLALASFSLEDQGDPNKINHPTTLSELKALAPEFDFDTYFATLGVFTADRALSVLNVTEPDFFRALGKLLATTPLEDLKVYLKWHTLQRSASLMGKDLERESFEFWQGYLRGKKTMEPRWKRCVQTVSGDLGDAVGQVFVSTIEGSSVVKSQTRRLIDIVKEIFSGNLNSLGWLDSPTARAAREKLGHINDKVAFPDHWKDYSQVVINDQTLLTNDLNATEFEVRRLLNKIGKPVDRTEWQMPPWEINAYYDPSLNEIVFPYGILQSPVFNIAASDGANMGALGATVGHELTHGFDNDGSKYDGFGNVKNWWPESIRKNFEERAQCLIQQANSYQVLPGMYVNGERTLTENIADQGGTKLAYLAFKQMSANRAPAPEVAGFNEEQQFFVSYAQSWCSKRTEQSMRLQLISNVHPPEEFRVNGVLMNLPQFAKAFGCAEGTPMAPRDRCSVW